MALRVAFRCRVSRQTTGRPSPVRPACSYCERGPASRPTRTSGPGAAARALAKLSGSLATLVSRTIVPFSSRMQRLLASNDTSIAAKYSTAVASGAAWGRSRTPPQPLVGGQPPRCQPVARPARLPDLDHLGPQVPLGAVRVQGHFGPLQDQQQLLLVRVQPHEQSVEGGETGAAAEDALEPRPQLVPAPPLRRAFVGLQV